MKIDINYAAQSVIHVAYGADNVYCGTYATDDFGNLVRLRGTSLSNGVDFLLDTLGAHGSNQ